MPQKPQGISRREFARRAAVLSAAATVAPLAPANAPTHESQEPPSGMPPLSPQSLAEAQQRYDSILKQYGSRFSEDQKSDLKRLSFFLQVPLDKLRAYPVQNGDNPALYLKPLVERERKPSPIPKPAAAKNS